MADVAKPALPEKAESAKPAAAAAGPTIVVPKPAILKPFPIAFEWITIPAGEFLMGSDKKKDKQALDNETPQHTLNLGEFRIARYPVTNAQYLEFVRTTKYKAPEHWKGGAIPTGKEQHPVVNVTWKDVQAFCQWANVRSPSEAEWEKAARGTDGRIWPWGNDAPTKEHCNFGMNVGDTTPVGKYLKGASPYGVMDMAGNVWEWTGSLYKPYPYRADDGRENPEGDGTRTLRGGSWGFDVDLVRCVFRNRHYPWLRNVGVGFRVVSPGY
jgi:serine/threonine-protein kinase